MAGRGRGRLASGNNPESPSGLLDRSTGIDMDVESSVNFENDEHGGQFQIGRQKRQRVSTGGNSANGSVSQPVDFGAFKTMAVDEKLNVMMEQLMCLDEIKCNMVQMNSDMEKTNKDIEHVKRTVSSLENRLRYVEFREIDLEARSRRNNILFYNIEESAYENPDELVRKFIMRKLKLPQGKDMAIQRAHRLGRPEEARDSTYASRCSRGRPRPLIVCFRDYVDTELIMSSTRSLRGSNYGVSRDYPNEINQARKALWPRCQEARKRGAKAKIVYPAKLVVNGNVVDDAFPEWSDILHGRNNSDRRPIRHTNSHEPQQHAQFTRSEHDWRSEHHVDFTPTSPIQPRPDSDRERQTDGENAERRNTDSSARTTSDC